MARRERLPAVTRERPRGHGRAAARVEPPRRPEQAGVVCADGEPVAEEVVRAPAQLLLVLAHEPERLGGLGLTEQRPLKQRAQRLTQLRLPLQLQLVQQARSPLPHLQPEVGRHEHPVGGDDPRPLLRGSRRVQLELVEAVGGEGADDAVGARDGRAAPGRASRADGGTPRRRASRDRRARARPCRGSARAPVRARPARARTARRSARRGRSCRSAAPTGRRRRCGRRDGRATPRSERPGPPASAICGSSAFCGSSSMP